MPIPTLSEAASTAASALHGTADRLSGDGAVASAAHNTADAIQSAANYLQDQDWRAMLSDLRGAIKRNPGITLLAAGALGFLLARRLARR
jgi:hypothetical protein